MTEPKHIPLPKRFTDAALERLAAWLITPLEAADDAHDVIDEEED